MITPIKIAAAQFPVSSNIQRNARYISDLMTEAAAADATVIQLPETALSGYAPKHWPTLDHFPWQALAHETESIRQLASQLDIWVILGSMEPVDDASPLNCLYVISNAGQIVARYDKQRLYGKEKHLFSVGDEPCVVEINGHKCGFLICYDNCFPELYEPYRDAGVGLLFHSFFNAENSKATSIKELIAANLVVRAADNEMWISASNSSKRYSPLSSCIVRPDGSSVRARRHVTSLVFDTYPNAELGWTYNNRCR
ncbi:MAG: carbon-nitrogen hydrolase family protein [Pseudomonadota bacterium]